MQTVAIDRLTNQHIGSYHLGSLLSQGPASSSYDSYHPTGQKVIITIFRVPEMLPSEVYIQFMAHFGQEAAILSKLQHPHLLSIYDYGEQAGYPYLVVSEIPGYRLAEPLGQHKRIAIEHAREVIHQIAEGLDYLHHNSIVHGAFSPTHIFFASNTDRSTPSRAKLQITGFGQTRILEMYGGLQGIEQSKQQQAYLLSIAGSLAGGAEYVAPEIIQGMPIDARTDVYALGVLLFKLLSGRVPFTGGDLLAPVRPAPPALSQLLPDAPAHLDAIISKALHQNPARRFQSVEVFAHALEKLFQPEASQNAPTDLEITSPLTIVWPEATTTGKQRAISASTKQSSQSAKTPAVRSAASLYPSDNVPAIDPFTWWSTVSMVQGGTPTSGKAKKNAVSPTRSAKTQAVSRQGRRRVVALLATGGAVAASVLGVGGFELMQHIVRQQAPRNTATAQIFTLAPQTQPTPTPPPATPSPQPTQAPTPKPQPTATPTPQPQHTGTVIGNTGMASNSARNLTDPLNGQDSVLIRLSSGNFVAYNRACTHEGVDVNYNPDTHQLECPAHGAIFDPANAGSVIQGPSNGPLATISIRVNPDGTITTG